MKQRLVVIGGDAAGMSAASQARRLRSADELEIVVFERGNFTSYSACGIPYFVADEVKDVNRLVARTPEVFRNDYAIDARTRHEVVEIDLARRAVSVTDFHAGRSSWEPFDDLLIATGSNPKTLDIEGADAAGVFGVETLDDGLALRRALDESSPRHAVVVGGGYIGLEIAEALLARGLEVALVEAAPQPMWSTLDPEIGADVGAAIRDRGIAVFAEEAPVRFAVRDGAVTAVETQERSVPADLVVLGLGVRPNVELARRAGIDIGETGAISVDSAMRTSQPHVWAAGDCVEKLHRVTKRPVRVALGTHANKEGRVAGVNITGGSAEFPGVIGTAVTKVCDLEIGRTGLTDAEADRAGLDSFSVVATSKTRAGYFPGAERIKVKLTAEQESGRLLGAQIVGAAGSAKRIDVCATAVWNEMSVREIPFLDLSYAPPFSPLWDPILIAARKAARALGEPD